MRDHSVFFLSALRALLFAFARLKPCPTCSLLFALCFFFTGAKESSAAGLNVQNPKPALDASGGGVLLDATPIGHLMYRFDYAFSYARTPWSMAGTASGTSGWSTTFYITI